MAVRADAQDRVMDRVIARRLAVIAHFYNVGSSNSRYRHNSDGTVLHPTPPAAAK
jgi:hypothetical protein